MIRPQHVRTHKTEYAIGANQSIGRMSCPLLKDKDKFNMLGVLNVSQFLLGVHPLWRDWLEKFSEESGSMNDPPRLFWGRIERDSPGIRTSTLEVLAPEAIQEALSRKMSSRQRGWTSSLSLLQQDLMPQRHSDRFQLVLPAHFLPDYQQRLARKTLVRIRKCPPQGWGVLKDVHQSRSCETAAYDSNTNSSLLV